MRKWSYGTVLVIAAGIGLAGCSTGPVKQDIHGMVTLDSQPVKEGRLRFAPGSGKGSGADAFIKEGKYAAKLMAGDYKVEIYSPRVIGKMKNRPPGPGQDADEVEETIPAKYNVQTTLTAEVKPGEDEINFPLLSK